MDIHNSTMEKKEIFTRSLVSSSATFVANGYIHTVRPVNGLNMEPMILYPNHI